MAGGAARYFRLRGPARVYYSAYEEASLCKLFAAQILGDAGNERSLVHFDNTTLGAAMENVLSLQAALSIN